MCAPLRKMIRSPRFMRREHPKNLRRAQHAIAIPHKRRAQLRLTLPRLRHQTTLPQRGIIRTLLRQLRQRILLCLTKSRTLRSTQALLAILLPQPMTGLWAITRISHHTSAPASSRQRAPFQRTLTPLTAVVRTHTIGIQAIMTELRKLPTDLNQHIRHSYHRIQATQIKRTLIKVQATMGRDHPHIRSRTRSKLS